MGVSLDFSLGSSFTAIGKTHKEPLELSRFEKRKQKPIVSRTQQWPHRYLKARRQGTSCADRARSAEQSWPPGADKRQWPACQRELASPEPLALTGPITITQAARKVAYLAFPSIATTLCRTGHSLSTDSATSYQFRARLPDKRKMVSRAQAPGAN